MSNDFNCEEKGTIVITEIKYCGEIITFPQELKIEYAKYANTNFIDIFYDFGMHIKEPYTPESNWFLKNGLIKKLSTKEIVENMVTFDIEHAFCHPNIDPNYTEIHWAIRGWLKDRVIIFEDIG